MIETSNDWRVILMTHIGGLQSVPFHFDAPVIEDRARDEANIYIDRNPELFLRIYRIHTGQPANQQKQQP